jgi:hypothetical protein
MSDGYTLCVMCAWRQTGNKKFSMSGATTIRCPEYTMDVSLKQADREQESNTKAK